MLLRYGVIPEPFNQDYGIDWKPQQYASDQDGSQHAEAETTLLQRYFDANLTRIMAPQDYLQRYCGMDANEAKSYLNRAKEYMNEQATLTMESGGMGGGDDGFGE
jgi:hypothetical protein